MTLLNEDAQGWVGKTVQSVNVNGMDKGVYMANGVKITFTDGHIVDLRLDWRGNECYISQYQNPVRDAHGRTVA